MGRKSKAQPARGERKPKDGGKKFKQKPCMFCQERIAWVDYKDVNLLRRYMSDRAKIKARRVNGNCVQHQSDVAMAIKTSRELALLPFATKVTSSRTGRGGGGRGRDDRPSRDDRPPRPGPGNAPPSAGSRVPASVGSGSGSGSDAGSHSGSDTAGASGQEASAGVEER